MLKKIVIKAAKRYYLNILAQIKDSEDINDYIYDLAIVKENQEHDEHVFHFSEDINITIQYSIPIIRTMVGKECEKYISFSNLTKLLSYDLRQSKEEFDRLRHFIVCEKKHAAKFLTVMYHVPSGVWLLLDGRHRYVEYEKFNPNESAIPVLVVNSESLLQAIVNKNGFIAYGVQQNMYVLQKCSPLVWKDELLSIRRFL